VINHGVSPELMRSVIGAMKAFHEQPAEVRAQVYRRETGTGVSYLIYLTLISSLLKLQAGVTHFRLLHISASV
jgi:hypothetical protein